MTPLLVILAFSGIGFIHCAKIEHGSTDDLYERAITNVWKSSDVNEDGVFSKHEMAKVFANYDLNGDHRVSRHEYVDFIVDPNPQLKEYSHHLFTSYDVNHDHHIDHKDYDGLLHKMDLDGDGIVNKLDFYHYWYKMLKATAHLHGHGAHLHG